MTDINTVIRTIRRRSHTQTIERNILEPMMDRADLFLMYACGLFIALVIDWWRNR